MRPWIIDAKDLSLTDDVASFHADLFHPTATIKRFLDPKNRSELIVVGPKGFGKTLLVKAKRLTLGSDPGTKLIPSNMLVDKPVGFARVFSRDEISNILEDRNYWRDIWLLTLMTCVLEHHDFFESHKRAADNLKSQAIRAIIESDLFEAPFDIFAKLLEMRRKEFFVARGDLPSLSAMFRRVHSPTVIFLDNIDEYFDVHLDAYGNSPLSGSTSKDLWYVAQLGLLQAARELAGVNSHVKVCATLRKEVLRRAMGEEISALQLKGSCVELDYTADDLLEVLRKNIRLEPTDNLREPAAEDELVRFVGADSMFIEHVKTGEEENFGDYLIRHTLMRPRDVVYIGREISDIAPHRRVSDHLRKVVNAAALEIATAYIREMSPHVDGLDLELLFRLLPTNVLEAHELTTISRQYNLLFKERHGVAASDVFTRLYSIGLLGYVTRSTVAVGEHQVFVAPGAATFLSETELPRSQFYLIHPVLSDLINRVNPDYFQSLSKTNIIGSERTWRRTDHLHFVVVGDVRSYTEIMSTPSLAEKFPNDFHSIVETHCSKCEYWAIEKGDSVTIVDRAPRHVLRAVKAISHEVLNSIYRKPMRFAGDYGVLSFNGHGKKRHLTGMALRTSARIEPLASPHTLALTAAAKTWLEAKNVGIRIKPYPGAEEDDLVDIAKPGREAEERVQLFEWDLKDDV